MKIIHTCLPRSLVLLDLEEAADLLKQLDDAERNKVLGFIAGIVMARDSKDAES